jgi:hypothetical protein
MKEIKCGEYDPGNVLTMLHFEIFFVTYKLAQIVRVLHYTWVRKKCLEQTFELNGAIF